MFQRIVYGWKLHVITLLIICIILIFAYGYFLRRTKRKDVLATDFYNDPVFQNIDGWSVSHFLFFMMLGFLYPNHYSAAIVAGVGWEIFETTLGQNKIMISGKRVQLVGSMENGVSTGNDSAYWYGKGSDITMDILGYMIGNWIAPCPDKCEIPCKSS